MKKIVVVGAGLAGLNATRILTERGHHITLVESSDRVGGRVATDVIDGYRCDRGFQVINPRYPEIVASDVMKFLDFIPLPRAIDLLIDNHVATARPSLASFFNSHFGRVTNKISILHYLRSSRSESAESVMLACGLGETYHRVLKPFLTGVFLTDPKNVSNEVARELVKSFIKSSPGIPAMGVGELPRNLALPLHNILLNTRVDALTDRGVKTSAGFIEADVVIVATDPTTASQLLGMNSAPLMNSSTTWYHSIPEGVITSPRLRVDGLIVNSIAISHLSPYYAPAGRTLVSSTTITSTTESEVRRQLANLWQCSTKNWELVSKYEIKQSLPRHGVGKPIESSVQVRENLYVIGDHRQIPSQQGAMASGRRAADLIDQGR